MKRWWWILGVITVLCLAIGISVGAQNRPVQIEFSGTRREFGNVVAIFKIENRTSRTMYFQKLVTLRGNSREILHYGEGYWSARDRGSGLPLLQPHTAGVLKIPIRLESREITGPEIPFHFEVEVINARSEMWNIAPLCWLPSRLKPPFKATVRSEVVSP